MLAIPSPLLRRLGQDEGLGLEFGGECNGRKLGLWLELGLGLGLSCWETCKELCSFGEPRGGQEGMFLPCSLSSKQVSGTWQSSRS